MKNQNNDGMNRCIENGLDSRYIARCTRHMKETGVPLKGWYCVEVYDVREDDPDASLENCQICGCSRVRYVHVMRNSLTGDTLCVGCICAGIMEDDIFGAKERERKARNRNARRRKFVQKPWETGIFDGLLFHKDKVVVMMRNDADETSAPVSYTVTVDENRVTEYKGKPIGDPLSAMYAAFDVLDPPV